MTLWRSTEHAKLGELHAVGEGILLRYRKLLDAGAGRVSQFLQVVIDKRGRLLDRVAAAEVARGDLPTAADREINEVRTLGDRVFKALLGENTLHNRLTQSEQEWQAMIRDAQGLEWADGEKTLLQALESESSSSLRLLKTLAE